MSKVLRPRVARKLVVTALGALAIGSAIPAAASAAVAPACGSTSESTPFLRFLDLAKYSQVPGGSFEQGAPGWSLAEAAVVSGNESYSVAGGSHSLQIAAGGEAVSPAFCVALEQPTFRFFARNLSGHGTLNVSLRWSSEAGQVHTMPVGSLGLLSGSGWNVSPVMLLDLQIPMLLESLGSRLQAELVFQATGGAWQIDDVYYDPYSR
jgi:hypothetical protein